jgi:hypothetical protein
MMRICEVLIKLFNFRMVIAPWKNDKGGGEEIGYYRAWIRSIEGFSLVFFK